jgi:hypothetical protein
LTSTTRPAERSLTPGERGLVASLFGAAVDPWPVRVYNKCWWPLQPRRIIMAPDGNLWCHPKGATWRADWSAETPLAQAFFLHEMTHVWQWQQGIYLPLVRPPFARYRYRLVPGKPLSAYGIEQQAEIVRHAHLARCGIAPTLAQSDQLVLATFA